MEFVSVRELSKSPKAAFDKLTADGKAIFLQKVSKKVNKIQAVVMRQLYNSMLYIINDPSKWIRLYVESFGYRCKWFCCKSHC